LTGGITELMGWNLKMRCVLRFEILKGYTGGLPFRREGKEGRGWEGKGREGKEGDGVIFPTRKFGICHW
jgi:hypothetical protein